MNFRGTYVVTRKYSPHVDMVGWWSYRLIGEIRYDEGETTESPLIRHEVREGVIKYS